MVKKAIKVLEFLSILVPVLFFCTTPQNPFSDPGNAKISLVFKDSKGNAGAALAVSDTVGDTVKIGVCPYLSNLIDSVEVTILKYRNNIDSVYVLKNFSSDIDTLWHSIMFSAIGKWDVSAKAIAHGGKLYMLGGSITIHGKNVYATIQPATESRVVDSIAIFTVSSNADTPLTYQWYHDTVELAGETGASFIKSHISFSDSGKYNCLVRDKWGDTGKAAIPAVLTVTPKVIILTNTKPVISVSGHSNILSTETCTLTVSVTDPDVGQMHAFTVIKAPTGYAYANNQFSWSPPIGYLGIDTMKTDTAIFAVTDDGQPALSDTQKVAIVVSAKILPPDSVKGIAAVSRDNGVFVFKWNKSENADQYVVYRSKDTTGFTQYGTVQETVFTNTIKDTSFYYYVIAINSKESSVPSQRVHSTVINSAPKWSHDSIRVEINEGTSLLLNLSDSCKDSNGDNVLFQMQSGLPATDSLVGTMWKYSSNYNDSGSYVVKIKATDGIDSSILFIWLNIHNVNRNPRFAQDTPVASCRVNAGDSLKMPFKASDPDGDSISYIIKNQNLPRQAAVLSNGKILYKSIIGDSGTFSLVLAAFDWKDTAFITVSIGIGNVNVPPQIAISGHTRGESISIKERKTLSFTVTKSDINSAETVSFLPIANSPWADNKGTGSFDTATGTFNFSPLFAASSGIANTVYANVSFIVKDNGAPAMCDTFKVNITVLDSNSSPVWKQSSDQMTTGREGTMLSYNFGTMFDKDNEGDSVSFTLAQGTPGNINQQQRQFVWTPGFADQGIKSIAIIAQDNHNPISQSTFIIDITVADSVVPVTLQSPSGLTHNSMIVSWSQSTEPEFVAYKVFYDTSANVTPSSLQTSSKNNALLTTDTLKNLLDNKHYYVKVFVYNSHATSSGSNIVQATTSLVNAPALVVSAPFLVNDSGAVRETTPTIAGTASSIAGIASVSATINGQAITVTGTTSWSFSFAGANKKQWNTISITVSDNTGKMTLKTIWVFYKPSLGTSDAPVCSNIKSHSIALNWSNTWTGAAYCDHYVIYRSSVSSIAGFAPVKDVQTTSSIDSGLVCSTNYWYKIQGYYATGGNAGGRDSSTISTTTSVKTTPYFTISLGGANVDIGYAVYQTSDSGFVIAGSSNSFSSNNNAYLIKTDKRGDTSWTKLFGGALNTVSRSMVVCNDGGFALCGTQYTNATAQSDIYVVKTTSNGAISWEKAYNYDDGIDSGFSIKQLSSYGYVIGGYFKKDSICTQLLAIDASGLFTNLHLYNRAQSGFSDARSVYQASDGKIIWGGTLSVFSGPSHGYVPMGIIAKCTSDLSSLVYNNTFNNNYVGFFGQSIIQEVDSSNILAGFTSNPGVSAYIICNNPGNNWSYTYSLGIRGAAYDIKKTSDGGYIFTGYTDGGIAGGLDVCLVKLNSLGQKVWDKTYGGAGDDIGYSVSQTFDGGYIICGSSTSYGSGTQILLIRTDGNGNAE
jgi:hypothetical protein